MTDWAKSPHTASGGRRIGITTLALFTAILCCETPGHAASGPQPPCGSEPVPSFPDVDSAPATIVWDRFDWTPPSCTGWAASGSASLVAVAGRFRHTTGVEGLRRRIGAVSGLTGLLYWSTTNRRWQPLVVDAYAVSAPSGDERRKDFSLDEVVEGRSLYLHQEDNLFGKATYRIQIVSASAGRLVFATANSSAVQSFGITLFAAGEIQSICFLERESKDVWRYYSLARIGPQASLLLSGHQASLINRAVALYRHLAGIPADKEPPASR
jgi:hypothetical protein